MSENLSALDYDGLSCRLNRSLCLKMFSSTFSRSNGEWSSLGRWLDKYGRWKAWGFFKLYNELVDCHRIFGDEAVGELLIPVDPSC